jgi:hypothetical protein
MSDNAQAQKKSKWPLAVRLAEASADLLRLRILAQCTVGETSPRRFHAEHGGATLPKIQRAFEVLTQYGWLELTRTEGEGGEPDEVERFYVGTEFPIFDNETFHELPDTTKALVVGRIVEALHLRSKEALKAGTMVQGREPHLSCIPIVLDEQGWEELISRIDTVFHWLIEEFDAAKERMADSGEDPIPVTIGLLAFESPERPPKPR